MEIRELKPSEWATALELVMAVFWQFEAPDYSPDGIRAFDESIHDPAYLRGLRMYGAFADGMLAGVLATRSGGSHIALFFVREAYQRQGIGRGLFQAALADCSDGEMTVHSSRYAIPVYHRLGFRDTGQERETQGIRYTPMQYGAPAL